MSSVPEVPAAAWSADQEAAKQIRGSTLLMVGRVISIAVNLLVQVIIIRQLTKDEFGAFAYAMALVTTASTLITLGIDRGITRFVAIYDEEGAYDKLFGTIALQLSTIVSLGAFLVVGVIGLQSWITGSLIDDRQTVAVLVVLIFLAPVQAFDGLMENLFAVFAKPRSIFFRRNILNPAMRLGVAALLVLSGGGPRMLAVGYLVTGLIGAAVYTHMLVVTLRKRGMLPHANPRALSFPVREVMAFTLPLLSTDLLFILVNTSDAILLGRYGGAEDVASYKVILPAAKLNQVILFTFGTLFIPLASRLFARNDREAIGRLYWQTAAWVAVFSFPIFVLTTSLAPALTEALFGARYASSWVYLALVSTGYYFSAALGLNSITLEVIGRIRYVVGVCAVVGVLNVILNIVLIKHFGPVGAAVTTLTTLVVYNTLNQLGLRSSSGIGAFNFGYAKVYLVIVGAALALGAVQFLADPPLLLAIALAGAASLAVFAVGRHELDVGETFPELRRVPLLGALVTKRRPGDDAGTPPGADL